MSSLMWIFSKSSSQPRWGAWQSTSSWMSPATAASSPCRTGWASTSKTSRWETPSWSYSCSFSHHLLPHMLMESPFSGTADMCMCQQKCLSCKTLENPAKMCSGWWWWKHLATPVSGWFVGLRSQKCQCHKTKETNTGRWRRLGLNVGTKNVCNDWCHFIMRLSVHQPSLGCFGSLSL